MVLGVAEWGGSEAWRKIIVVGVLGALWLVGFAATPAGTKRWAWEQIKVYLWVLVLDEVRRVGWGAGTQRAGRRGRGRW